MKIKQLRFIATNALFIAFALILTGSSYQSSLEEFCNYYKVQCRQNNIDYVRLTTDMSLDISLSEYLLKRKRLK